MCNYFYHHSKLPLLYQDYNKIKLSYFYTSDDFFRCSGIITNYYWDKDQRAFNIFFHSNAKKNFQISSNMLFTFAPKSNLKYLYLRFWKYQKYLLTKSQFYLSKFILHKFNDKLFYPFPLSAYDDIINDNGIFFFYDIFTKKYRFKPFFSTYKYESNNYEADSFLTIGLIFNNLFPNSIFLWSNPYIDYYCWVTDIGGLQKSYTFSNFYYDSNLRLRSLKNFYNFLYMKKFFNEYNTKKSYITVVRKHIKLSSFLSDIYFYFFTYLSFYFYMRMLFYGYTIKNINNYIFQSDILLKFFLKTSLNFLFVSAFRLRNFIPKFIKLKKRKFFKNLKKKLENIDLKFSRKKFWINIDPKFSLKNVLNKYVINSTHNNLFISTHIHYNSMKNKDLGLFKLFKHNFLFINNLYSSYDNLDESLIDRINNDLFIFIKKFIVILSKNNNDKKPNNKVYFINLQT